MSKTHGLTPPQGLELFDWENRWESEVLPILDRPKVKKSIDKFKQERWKHRAPRFKGTNPFLPYQAGLEPDEGWTDYTANELGAYAPFASCHWIYPFCKSVGEQLYPGLRWGVISGFLHTVAVGCVPDEQGFPYFPGVGRIAVVSDILMSYIHREEEGWTAEACIAYAMFSRFYLKGLDTRVDADGVLQLASQALSQGVDKNTVADEMLIALYCVFCLNIQESTTLVMDALKNGHLTIGKNKVEDLPSSVRY